MTDVFCAEYYATRVRDRELYETTLRKVLESPVDINPGIRLMNERALDRARCLLKKQDITPW